MTNLTPVYTPAEKIKKLILFGSILVLIGALHYVVLPWVKSTSWYLCNPHGLDYFYRSIGLFPLIFMPFLIAAVPKHLRIIQLKQYPLPEQKTWTAHVSLWVKSDIAILYGTVGDSGFMFDDPVDVFDNDGYKSWD